MRKDRDPRFKDFLDCSTCLEANSAVMRAHWHCGWIAESQWKGHGFPHPHEWPVKPDTCPGYLVVLPQVQETARACTWFDKGLLEQRYEGDPLTGRLMDSIEIMKSGISEVEAHMMTPKETR